LTTVMSSSSMKVATETAIRVHHLRSIGVLRPFGRTAAQAATRFA
jgi:hypothetical protein